MRIFSKSAALAGVTVALLGFSMSAAAVTPTIDFTGDYDVAKWTPSLGDGLIDLTGATSSVTLIGGNGGSPSTTSFTIAASSAATVSFKWDYSTEDNPVEDPAFFLWGTKAMPLTSLTRYALSSSVDGAAQVQNGYFTFFGRQVAKDDVFGFSVESSDGTFGPARLTITDFKVSPVPEPGSLAMLMAGLIVVFAARKRNQR